MASTQNTVEETNRAGTHCRECRTRFLVAGDATYCEDCGLVVAGHQLDRGPEWSPFNREESVRVGAPLTPARHDRGLSTEIGFGRDGQGNGLASSKRRQLHRLRREHSRARWRSKAERNLAHGLGEVSRLAAALELPKSVRDRAASIFREGHGAGLAQGRSIEGLAAASVYAACRCHEVLRTIAEVAAASTASTADVKNDYGVLNQALGLAVSPYTPALYLDRLASEFDVPASLRRRATTLLRRAEVADLNNGSRPAGLAAACLYRAAKGSLTQVDIADQAGVTPVTIRSRVRELDAIGDY